MKKQANKIEKWKKQINKKNYMAFISVYIVWVIYSVSRDISQAYVGNDDCLLFG